LEAHRYTKTGSWERGRYSISKPGKSLVAMLENYRMNRDNWVNKIDNAVRGSRKIERSR
jgi:hypothetical protein